MNIKSFEPIPLDKNLSEVKEHHERIVDVTNYVHLVARGSYEGVNAELVVKLKKFLLDIREQLINAYDKHPDVVKSRKKSLEKDKNQQKQATKA